MTSAADLALTGELLEDARQVAQWGVLWTAIEVGENMQPEDLIKLRERVELMNALGDPGTPLAGAWASLGRLSEPLARTLRAVAVELESVAGEWESPSKDPEGMGPLGDRRRAELAMARRVLAFRAPET